MSEPTFEQNKKPVQKPKSTTSETPEKRAPENPLADLQQQVGNQAINQLMGGNVQRAETSEAEEEDLDISNLGKKGRLKGHPAGDEGRPGSPQLLDAQPPDIQKRGPFGVEASVNLTLNPPVFDSSKTAAEIQAEHPGHPGVVAWAEPDYSVIPSRGTTRSADIDAEVQERIDLPSDYTGTRGQILRDHELGHDNIAKKAARAKLKDSLESDLESKFSLSAASVQAAITKAVGEFEAEEENLSIVYDAVDYPRMELAYYAARTSLTVLEGDSENIAAVATSLRNFNNTLASASPGQGAALAQELTAACEALDPDDLNMLQYNPEFKQMVEMAKVRIDAFVEDQKFFVFSNAISMLSEASRATLDNLKTTLDGFTWHAPEGDAI